MRFVSFYALVDQRLAVWQPCMQCNLAEHDWGRLTRVGINPEDTLVALRPGPAP